MKAEEVREAIERLEKRTEVVALAIRKMTETIGKLATSHLEAVAALEARIEALENSARAIGDQWAGIAARLDKLERRNEQDDEYALEQSEYN